MTTDEQPGGVPMIESPEAENWPPHWLDHAPFAFGWSVHECRDEQPRLGVTMNWNKPGQWFKPFVVVSLGYQQLNIGWLFS